MNFDWKIREIVNFFESLRLPSQLSNFFFSISHLWPRARIRVSFSENLFQKKTDVGMEKKVVELFWWAWQPIMIILYCKYLMFSKIVQFSVKYAMKYLIGTEKKYYLQVIFSNIVFESMLK